MIRQAIQLLAASLPLLALVAPITSQADVLRMEETNRTMMIEPPIHFVQTPRRGLSMDGVRKEFGNPASTTPAVGDPPITRWDYEKFYVFFEHNLLLHAVIPDKPLHVDHQDELQPANVNELR